MTSRIISIHRIFQLLVVTIFIVIALPRQNLTIAQDNFGIRGAIWNQNETQLLTWSYDGTVHIWDTQTGELRFILEHRDSVINASWNRDETRIIAWLADRTVRLWNAETGKQRLIFPHVNGSLAWNHSGTHFYTWTNAMLYIWDIQTGDFIIKIPQLAHHGAIWNQDDTKFLTWTWSAVELYDAQTGDLLFTTETAGFEPLWNPQETQLMTVARDRGINIFNTNTGDLVLAVPNNPPGVSEGIWNPAGTQLLALMTKPTKDIIQIWDIKSGEMIFELSSYLPNDVRFSDPQWSADGTRLLITVDDTVQIWDLQTRKILVTLPTQEKSHLIKTLWSPNERKILILHPHGIISVWESESGRELYTLDTHHETREVRWNVDGTRILTIGTVAQVWDAQTGELLNTFEHNIQEVHTTQTPARG